MRSPLHTVLAAAFATALVMSATPALAMAAPPDWHNPVSGGLLRSFDRGSHAYAAGAHRGVDLAARLGQPVQTACAGRVAFAGLVAGRPVVTVACGSWRATHLPVLRPRVTAGERVGPGHVLGVVGRDDAHSGLHLGIRRSDRRFGYVDPWLLLVRARPGDSPRLAPPPRERPPRRIAPRSPRLVPRSAPVAPPTAGRHVAPFPVWIGLACLLTGCLAGRAKRRVRFGATRRSPSTTALTGHVRSRTPASSPPG